MESALSSNPSNGSVMAAIDGDSEAERLILADIAHDSKWISIPTDAALDLEDWC